MIPSAPAAAAASDSGSTSARRPAAWLVEPLSLAAAAAGADGIIVEVHPDPDEAICDGPQQLYTDSLPEYVAKLEQAAAIAGKVLSSATA